MSLNLTIIQKPLDVCETHSDHTWNVALNDYSAYTDIRLIVDIYSNPYGNDLGPGNVKGSVQSTKKEARLLVPVNQYGNCIFNVETIIRNFCDANPRNMSMVYNPTIPGAENNPYLLDVMKSDLLVMTAQTSQATIVNNRHSTIGFSNGFNGGYSGFENIMGVNEYRCVFGVQYTSGKTTTQIIDTTNYNVYSGWTGQSISPSSASTQPYGITIFPGVQDNKRYGVSTLSGFTTYYSGTNLTGQYNYLNTKVYSWAMDTKISPYNQPGEFMGVFGEETIPMTAFGGQIQQTRWRTHYYNCPIVLPFMFSKNQLYDNSQVVKSISYLQKTQGNGQMNYDSSQSYSIGSTSGATYLSFLGQRIAYGIFIQNPNYLTQSDVAIFLSSGTCDPSGADRVSEIVQYKMVGEECFNDPYSFLFLNRNGVWDTYTFTKKSQKTYLPQKKKYSSYKSLNTKLWNRQSYDAAQSVYYGLAEERFIFDSGFVYQNDRDIIEQLIMSPYVYMIMNNFLPEQGLSLTYPYLIPIIIEDKEVQVFQQKYQRIYQYTINCVQVPYRRYDLPY